MAPKRPRRPLLGSSILLGVALLTSALIRPSQAQLSYGLGTGPEQMLADQMSLLVKRILTTNGDQPLRADQLVRARILLDMALEAAADDPELWLWRDELAESMQDPQARLRSLQRYCSLQPDDDAALLKMIMLKIEPYQTLEQRIEGIEKILDSTGGKRLSSALRSRLASYTAQGAFELGDVDRFIKRLKQALKLDRGNRQAAELMLAWVGKRSGSARAVGEAITHLVAAAPVDPAVRRRLAGWFLSRAAYPQAAQQFEVCVRLSQQPPNAQVIYEWAVCLAASGQPDAALGLLEQAKTFLPGPDQAPGQGQAANQPVLPLELETLRLVILHQANEPTPARGSFERLSSVLKQEAQAGRVAASVDLLWLSVLLGQQLSQEPDLEAVRDQIGQDHPLVARLAGWIQLRQENPQAARTLLEPLSQTDPFALYGLALTHPSEAGSSRWEVLKQVVRQAPGTLAAMMAMNNLAAAGVPMPRSPEVTAIERQMETWSNRLVAPNPRENRWIILHATCDATSYRYLEPITARLTLRNVTDWPLSLGDGQTVPSSLVLFVSPRIGGDSSGGQMTLVVDMGRRLSLGPGESFEVDTRLDRSPLGLMLAMNPTASFGVSTRAALDPVLTDGQELVTHLMGATHTLSPINRRGLAATQENIDYWLGSLDDLDPAERLSMLARVIVIASRLRQSPDDGPVVGQIAEAVNFRYQDLLPVEQAMLLCFLPPDPQATHLFKTVHELAQRSTSPLVRVTYLATQVTNPKSTAINDALRHPDPRIADFAKHHARALELTPDHTSP